MDTLRTRIYARLSEITWFDYIYIYIYTTFDWSFRQLIKDNTDSSNSIETELKRTWWKTISNLETFPFFSIWNSAYSAAIVNSISTKKIRSIDDTDHFEISRDRFLIFERAIDRGCVQASPSTAPFVSEKKERGRLVLYVVLITEGRFVPRCLSG